MNKLRLKASKNLSEAEIKGFLHKITGQKEKPKEVVLLNPPVMPEFPAFPKQPEPYDYSEAFEKIAAALEGKDNKDTLEEIKKLNNSINSLSLATKNQTEKLVDAMTMQSNVLAELVLAYREPKKIIRDDKGRPEGITNG